MHLDASWDDTADYVLDTIRAAGFNPRNVRYLILTHARIDHFVGAAKIRETTRLNTWFDAIVTVVHEKMKIEGAVTR